MPEPHPDTAIVLFRRDLRLHDNPALHAACRTAACVLPVYIHDPEADGDWPPGAASRWWLHHSLGALGAKLRQRYRAPLLILRGEALPLLQHLARRFGASAVHWNRCYEAARIVRDRNLKQALREDGVEVHSHNATLLAEPWKLATDDGRPYRVYSPFARRFARSITVDAPLTAPEHLAAPVIDGPAPDGLCNLDALELLPRPRWDAGLAEAWTPGEDGAWQKLNDFLDDAAAAYHKDRDRPDHDGTSRLSPHLHFGELSPRQCWTSSERVVAVDSSATRGVEHFRRELLWREFAYHLLYHYPDTAIEPLNQRFAGFPWRRTRDYADDLAAFQRGMTGIPIVDAGMRQLWHTGWMHNRVRMIVASFLTKNLLIPWQEGAAWFWDTLVDADLASNTLGWQWAAGCGADAAPYFRIFNPVLQAEKFDPNGAYLRRWLPELAALPDAALRAPWQAKAAVLGQHGIRLGHDYPEPIVDLKATRERALAAYERVKG